GIEVVLAGGLEAAEQCAPHIGLTLRNAALSRLHAALRGDHLVDRLLHLIDRRLQALIGIEQTQGFTPQPFGAMQTKLRLAELAARFIEARLAEFDVCSPTDLPEAVVCRPTLRLGEQGLVFLHVRLCLIEIAKLDVALSDLALGVELEAFCSFPVE